MADHKIKALIADAYTKAKKILTKDKAKIELITSKLLDTESLSREEFEEMMEE